MTKNVSSSTDQVASVQLEGTDGETARDDLVSEAITDGMPGGMTKGNHEGSVRLDAVFDILKNRRRRRVLQYLLQGDGTSTLGTLAEHLASIENDKPEQLLSSQERKRVYIGLYQCHLPRMDMTGVIEFDRHRGTVKLADWADILSPYVREGSEKDRDLRGGAIKSSTVIIGAVLVTAGVLTPGVPGWIGTGMVLWLIALVLAGTLRYFVALRLVDRVRPGESIVDISR